MDINISSPGGSELMAQTSGSTGMWEKPLCALKDLVECFLFGEGKQVATKIIYKWK